VKLTHHSAATFGTLHRPSNFNSAKVVLVLINDFLLFGHAELENDGNFFVSRKEFTQSFR
jgi:hypothetical protein